MNEILENKLKNLPDKPGIYQFLNDKGKVIYVGKAKILKNRVRSYFHSGVDSPKTLALVSKIHDLELIVTDNEIEALVLENNLIKQFKPRYNVNLKDDKTYPFIKITSEPFPRIYPTRTFVKDGSKYFGPFTDVRNMKTSLRMINQIFKIRSCKLNLDNENIYQGKFKVCLDYHIKKCDGPCEALISSEKYNEMVNEVVKVLKGRTDDLVAELNTKMQMAVSNLEFESAAEIRDKLERLKSLLSKQKVVNDSGKDQDIFAVAFEGKDSTCSIFNIRNGRIIGKKQLNMSIEDNEELPQIYYSAIKFFYAENTDIPDEIVLELEPEDEELLKEWLDTKAERKIKFVYPQRGDVKSLIKLGKENAILQLKEIQLQKMKNAGSIPYPVSALQRDLRLKTLPRKIECFDISNLQGTDTVASLVVFEDGKPKKSQYRKFIIKEVVGPDDFASMQEVIRRRYTRLLNENLPFPDLIMVDGGKGQLSSAVEILNEIGVKNIQIIGLAKRLEEVFFPGDSIPASIPKTSSGLKLLQQVRDEAHRFAITFHRKKRSERIITSELDSIKGFGPATVKTLLESFGSVSQIKSTPIEDLAKVIGKKKTDILINYFNENKS